MFRKLVSFKKKLTVGEMHGDVYEFFRWLRSPEGIKALKKAPTTGKIINCVGKETTGK